MCTNGDTLLDKLDALRQWIAETPGACNGGRAMATDDPDRLGWDVIEAHLREDGFFVFRHVATEVVPDIETRVAAWGFDLQKWSIFHATADDVLKRRRPVAPRSDYSIGIDVEPTPEVVTEVVRFLKDRGIRPFTRRIIGGLASPSALVTARDADGRLRAVSFGHFCFNEHSAWQGTAWCGLVAVEEQARGSGLGRTVNDAAIDAMLGRHHAEGVVEYAAEDNVPSRRMIEGSGLSLRSDIVSCAATRQGISFTR